MSILDVEEFLRREESSYLTIADIVKMKPGETIEVLSIDRNFYDAIFENYTPTGAKEFFKYNYIWLIAKSGDGLDVKWKQSENGCDCGMEEYEEREFHLNYKEGSWYPLEGGKLPGRCDQNSNLRLTEDGESKHWSSYPETTKVGWRGPMLPYRCVAECEEKLYYNKMDDIEWEAYKNDGWLSEIRKPRLNVAATTIQRWWRARAVPVPVLPCSKTRRKKMKSSRKKVSSMCKAGARKGVV
jgi:hypothetical protein